MAGRRLGADEAALWARVRASVRPLPGRRAEAIPLAAPQELLGRRKVHTPSATPSTAPAPPAARHGPGQTLDRGWDRRLLTGAVMPDVTIDLHGHHLASAHAALDVGLARAIAHGNRVVLLVTGKPPRPESQRPHARGAIRAAIEDWLRLSRHAGAIAAIRGAHPRHGGTGALYIVLRRQRTTSS